jgi:septum site-determining protein MinC
VRVVVSSAARSRDSFRVRGRSFMAFVLAPAPPVTEWLAELDGQIGRSQGFFVGRPVVLDLSSMPLTKSEFAAVISELQARDVRVMGVENVDPSLMGPGLPPLLKGGRPASGPIELHTAPSANPPSLSAAQSAGPAPFLVIDQPVRSGQSIVFPHGDVTIIGSVGSGAEVIAGGSVHIYGVLRGRAMAGSTGNARARIFCRSIEAELIAIDGLYRTADDIDGTLRNRAIHAWLEGEVLMMAALD